MPGRALSEAESRALATMARNVDLAQARLEGAIALLASVDGLEGATITPDFKRLEPLERKS